MKCCHQFGTKYTIPPKNFSEVVQGRAMYLRLFATRAKPNTSALHIFALPAGTLQYQIALLHTKIITNTTLMKVIISFLTCNTTDTVRLHWRNQHIHAGLSRRGIDRAKTEEKATPRVLNTQVQFGTKMYYHRRNLEALDFDLRVILSFRSPFLTLRFSLNIKSFTEQNNFYRSDILHDFSISSF